MQCPPLLNQQLSWRQQGPETTVFFKITPADDVLAAGSNGTKVAAYDAAKFQPAKVDKSGKPGLAGPLPDDRDERWDKSSVHAFQGTYGDYLLGKVSKVFPQLVRRVL